MTKQVRETAAGKSLSVYVILNAKGAHVATVQAHYSDGGTCTVDAWNIGDGPTERSALAMGYTFGEDRRIASGPHAGDYAYKVAGLQQGRAGGGGYDKFTAAIRGFYIDGIKITDHCSREGAPKPPKGRKTWPSDAKAPKGYSFANYVDGAKQWPDGGQRWPGLAPTESGFSDCYRDSGLDVLKAYGYRVIQAL